MSKKPDTTFTFRPTEEQFLRLQLARQKCETNIARRDHTSTEWRFYELLRHVAEAHKGYIEAQHAELEREGQVLTRQLLEVAEQIKHENGWPEAVKWDCDTLAYSGPENIFYLSRTEKSERKLRIQ